MKKMKDYRDLFKLVNSVGNKIIKYKGPQPKTIEEAFDISLAKWYILSVQKDNIVDGTGITSCGLCLLFYYDICVDCPVYKVTGKTDCKNNVSYNKFIESYIIEERATHAKNEYNFLFTLAVKYCPEVEWINWITEDNDKIKEENNIKEYYALYGGSE